MHNLNNQSQTQDSRAITDNDKWLLAFELLQPLCFVSVLRTDSEYGLVIVNWINKDRIRWFSQPNGNSNSIPLILSMCLCQFWRTDRETRPAVDLWREVILCRKRWSSPTSTDASLYDYRSTILQWRLWSDSNTFYQSQTVVQKSKYPIASLQWSLPAWNIHQSCCILRY